jgi:c-di-GMP-binding flagellar brake protein YcgR
MRQVYRIELSGSFHLRGILRLSEEQDIEGRLVDVSTHGASLAFLPGSDPNLTLGSELDMTFIGPNGIQVEAVTVVRNRFESDDFVRYGFQFKDVEGLNKNIPILMRAVFNRRRAPRVVPDKPIEVELSSPELETIAAKLVNLSTTGLAIEVPFTLFESYQAGLEVSAAFNLPGSISTVRVTGPIRGCRMQGPSVHLGIEIEEDKTPDFERQVAALENFVCSREVLSPYVPG